MKVMTRMRTWQGENFTLSSVRIVYIFVNNIFYYAITSSHSVIVSRKLIFLQTVNSSLV